MAAALLLGKDQVIQQILPHYKIDALVRIQDTDRYDDREYIQTNLIEAYEQLMAFVAKHLPDKFYLEGDQRVSLRTKIFREIVANLIVHREYTNAHPCTFVIYSERVETINANNPHGEGPIDPKNFAPFPKNQAIAKFYIQLGRVDELGSGVLNVNRLIKEYAGKDAPQFIEGNVFKMILPVPHPDSEGLNEGLADNNEGLSEGLNEELKAVLGIINNNPGIQAKKIAELLNNRPIKTVDRQIKTLVEKGLVERRGSKKAGGYFITKAPGRQ